MSNTDTESPFDATQFTAMPMELALKMLDLRLEMVQATKERARVDHEEIRHRQEVQRQEMEAHRQAARMEEGKLTHQLQLELEDRKREHELELVTKQCADEERKREHELAMKRLELGVGTTAPSPHRARREADHKRKREDPSAPHDALIMRNYCNCVPVAWLVYETMRNTGNDAAPSLRDVVRRLSHRLNLLPFFFSCREREASFCHRVCSVRRAIFISWARDFAAVWPSNHPCPCTTSRPKWTAPRSHRPSSIA